MVIKIIIIIIIVIKTIGIFKTCRIQSPDTRRAGRVGAAHSRAAGRGGAGVQQDAIGSIRPGDKPSLLPSCLLNIFSGARTV